MVWGRENGGGGTFTTWHCRAVPTSRADATPWAWCRSWLKGAQSGEGDGKGGRALRCLRDLGGWQWELPLGQTLCFWKELGLFCCDGIGMLSCLRCRCGRAGPWGFVFESAGRNLDPVGAYFVPAKVLSGVLAPRKMSTTVSGPSTCVSWLDQPRPHRARLKAACKCSLHRQ